uniref:Uncharacterized protein n=1 Tax=Arundo donax TaxID=35708 RepID=A0A0A9BRL1_ARUDO
MLLLEPGGIRRSYAVQPVMPWGLRCRCGSLMLPAAHRQALETYGSCTSER